MGDNMIPLSQLRNACAQALAYVHAQPEVEEAERLQGTE